MDILGVLNNRLWTDVWTEERNDKGNLICPTSLKWWGIEIEIITSLKTPSKAS